MAKRKRRGGLANPRGSTGEELVEPGWKLNANALGVYKLVADGQRVTVYPIPRHNSALVGIRGSAVTK